MRHLFLLYTFVITICGSRESHAGRKIQWQKYMNDTTIQLHCSNYIFQDACVDTNNDIYFTYTINSLDTTLPFLKKVSAEGTIIFDKVLIPFALNKRMVSIYDRSSKLYFDVDNNLVCIHGGLDTLGNQLPRERYIHLSKWTKEGVLIAEKWDYLNEECHSSTLTDFSIMPNGDIYVINDTRPTNFDPLNYTVRKYNKNFDSLFSLQKSEPIDPSGNTTIAINNNFLYLAYSTSPPNPPHSIILKKIDMNTGLDVWTSTIHAFNYFVYYLKLRIYDGNLYLNSSRLLKLSESTGQLLAQDSLHETYDFIIDTTTNTISTYSVYNPLKNVGINGIIKYNLNLDIDTFISLPYRPHLLEKKNNDLYIFCYEAELMGPTYRVLMSKIDSNNALSEPYFYTYPEPQTRGMAQKIVVDHNGDVIIFNEVVASFVDSLAQTHCSAPIFIQKLCYNCVEDIKGRVFIESAANCTYDSTETIIENNLVHLLPEDIYTATDSLGFYSFVKSSGIATVEYLYKVPYTTICNTAQYTVNLANGPSDSLDFGLQIAVPMIDLKCDIISGFARPGFKQNTILDAENIGNQQVLNSTLKLSIDSLFSFESSSIAPDSIAGNTLFWHIDTMKPGEIKSITVVNHVNAPIGYQYKHFVDIHALGDTNLVNNTDTTSSSAFIIEVVIGSFDPNYKAANPIGITSQHFIENNIPINYYVEFQNTGTDTAFNIKIFDDLDTDLDINTLVIKKASHPMHYKIVNRQLQFYFDNVMLVDSNKDYKKSIGYLNYTIMPRKSLDGTVIKNKADIYFDFNDPVATNTTFHTIGRPGCLFDNENLNDFNFFPNPVSDQSIMITVNMATDEKYTIVLSDIAGKEIYKLSSQKDKKGKYRHPINFSKMVNAGIYFLTLKTASNNVSKKVIFGN